MNEEFEMLLSQVGTKRRSVVMATVVDTFSSAPRPPGTTMICLDDGSVVGSLSGGCVEGAVYEIAEEVKVTGTPRRERFGISDHAAAGVGLTCGGELEVFVQVVDASSAAIVEELLRRRDDRAPVALTTVVCDTGGALTGRHMVIGPGEAFGSVDELLDDRITAACRPLLSEGRSGLVRITADGAIVRELEVFVASYAPKPRLIIFGAIDFADALCRIAVFLGFHVTVVDARGLFATRERFPLADEIVVRWPSAYLADEHRDGRIDARTAICILTHDPRFDVPLVRAALSVPALAYLGVMGSRRTQRTRDAELVELGVDETELSRISGPIGLDLGGVSAEETAISIAAEIIATRRGGTGSPLRSLDTPIHRRQTGTQPRRQLQ